MLSAYELKDRRYDLYFRVTTSIFYHSRRVRFLQSINLFFSWLTILLNAGSVIALTVSLAATVSAKISQHLPLCVAAFTFLVRSFFLNYKIDDRISEDDLATQQLRQLQADIEVAGEYDENMLNVFVNRAKSIPAPQYTLRILHDISYNNAIEALQGDDPQYRIPGIPERLWFWQRIAAPILDLPPKPKRATQQNPRSRQPASV